MWALQSIEWILMQNLHIFETWFDFHYWFFFVLVLFIVFWQTYTRVHVIHLVRIPPDCFFFLNFVVLTNRNLTFSYIDASVLCFEWISIGKKVWDVCLSSEEPILICTEKATVQCKPTITLTPQRLSLYVCFSLYDYLKYLSSRSMYTKHLVIHFHFDFSYIYSHLFFSSFLLDHCC